MGFLELRRQCGVSHEMCSSLGLHQHQSPERGLQRFLGGSWVPSFLSFILPDPGAREGSTRKGLAFQKLSLLLASDRFPGESLPGSGGPLAVGDPSLPCPALSRWQREGRGEPVPRAPRTVPRAPDRRGPPPGSFRGAGVLGGEPLGSLGSAPAASQTCLVASPLGAWVPSNKTICVLPGFSQRLSRLSPLLSLRGLERLPVWPRGTVGGVLGAEQGSCRRTPRGRSEKKAGGAPSSAAEPGRWEVGLRREGRRGRARGPGLGQGRRVLGGARTRIGGRAPVLEPPALTSPRPTPPRCIPRAALAATLAQRGPGGGRAHRRPSSAVGWKTWRSGLRGRRGVRGPLATRMET